MWRRITAGLMALAMSFGWAPAGWAEVVVGEEIAVNGAVELPADPVPAGTTSAPEEQAVFDAALLEAIEIQKSMPSEDPVPAGETSGPELTLEEWLAIELALTSSQETSAPEEQAVFDAALPEAVEIQKSMPSAGPEVPVRAHGPVLEGEEGYDDVMAALIAQIDGDINTAQLTAMDLTAALDYLEYYSSEEGDSAETETAGTGSEVPEIGPEDEGSFVTTEETEAAEPAAPVAEPVAPAAAPPPIVGTASGPTTITGIQAMLNGQIVTLNAQRTGLRQAQDNLITIRDRAQRLFNARAIARAELDHANAMVVWIGRRVARVDALIAIANAPAATAPALIGAFNAAAMGRLNARVASLEGLEGVLVGQITGPVWATLSAEGRNNLMIQLGLVRADLAQARQDKANGQATVTAGGIVLADWDPAPPRPGP